MMGADKEIQMPENERFSDSTGLHMLTEDTMWCRNCKYCEGNVLSCELYEQKPSAVLDGDECPNYEPK